MGVGIVGGGGAGEVGGVSQAVLQSHLTSFAEHFRGN